MIPTSEPNEEQKDLIRVVFNHIHDHPDTWEQEEYHCGTKHCFWGWVEVLTLGLNPEGEQPRDSQTFSGQRSAKAKKLLGIDEDEFYYLVNIERTIEELHAFCWYLLNPVVAPELGRL